MPTGTTTELENIIELDASDDSQYIIATTQKWKVTFFFIQIGREFKLDRIMADGLTGGKSTGEYLTEWDQFQVVLTPNLYEMHAFNSKPRYADMKSKASVLELLKDCKALQVNR